MDKQLEKYTYYRLYNMLMATSISGGRLTICQALDNVIYIESLPAMKIKDLPILYAHKPKTLFNHDGTTTTDPDALWFPKIDILSRIRLLEEVIEEIE